MSVFLVLIFFSGAASASSEINQTLTTEYNDEIVNVGDTDEKLTVEVSSAGSDDDSGLKELDSEIQENKLNKTNFIKKENNLLKASNDNLKLGTSINIDGSTFEDIQTAINGASAGDIIYLNSPKYVGSGTQININKAVTIIGCEGCTLDAQEQSGIFYQNSYNSCIIKNIKFINCNTTNAVNVNGGSSVVNCSFINCSSSINGALNFHNGNNAYIINCSFINCSAGTAGGAIEAGVRATVVNCSFMNCSAGTNGGAIRAGSSSNIVNCSFMNCSAGTNGGAIYTFSCSVVNCSFMNCSAGTFGGAIYGPVYAINSTFLDNKAKSSSITSSKDGLKLNLIFSGNENYINAIYYGEEDYILTFDNVTYWNGEIVNSYNFNPIKSNQEAGINITLEIYDSNHNLIDNLTSMTDINGQISYDYSALPNGKYSYNAYHIEDNYYTAIQTSGSFDVNKYNIIILNNNTNNVKQNQKTKITAKITDINNATIKPEGNKLIFILPNGTEIEANYDGSNFYAEYTFNEIGNYSIGARLEPATFSYNGYDYTLNKVYTGTLMVYNPSCNITESVVPGNPGENTTLIVTVPSDVDGVITVLINGTEYPTVKVNDTTYVANVTLPAGNYTTSAKLSGDSKYDDNQTEEILFEIVKVEDYSVVVGVVPGYPGENTTVTVTVPGDVTGVVTVLINGTEYPTVKVNDTTYVANVTLPAGNYSASGRVSDDPKYADKISDDVLFEVSKVSADDYSVDVVVVPGYPGENTTVTVTVPGDVTGVVTVLINGTEYPTVKVNDTTYVANVTLPAGNYSASGRVSDDPKYADKISDDVLFEVSKVSADDYSVDVVVVPGYPGENTTVTVTVPGDVTGVVTVLINGTEYPTVKVNDTTYVANVTLPAGNYSASGRVSDDPKYADKISDDVLFEVSKVSADDYSVDVVVVPGYPGENTTVTVTVPGDVTGVVTVLINGTEYPTVKVNDTTYVANVTLPAGNYSASGRVSDDPKYADKISDDVLFEVSKVSADDYSVDVVVVPGYPGENTTVTVTVPGDVTGVVTVLINGTEYPTVKVNDTTYVANVTLPAGNYSASGRVSDDPKYADKISDDVLFEVKNGSECPIDVVVDPGNPGENTTVTVTVPEDVTGDVTVIIDGIEYPTVKVNDITYVANVTLPAGNHTASATVSDDPKYEDKASDDVPFEVKKVGECPIDVVVDPGNPGENTTVTVTVPEDVTGDVTVIIDGIEYPVDPINGTVILDVPLPEGNHTVEVKVVDDPKYNDTDYGPDEFEVKKDDDYSIVVDVYPGNPGENTTVTVTVPEDVTGDVTVIIDGIEYPVTPVNGTATIELPLDVGNHTASATVSDDPKYEDKASDDVPFEVKKVGECPIDVVVYPGNPGENTTVTVTVPEDVTGDVTVIIDGIEYPVDPINGTVILDVPLPEGNHTVEVKVVDDPKYNDTDYGPDEFEVKKDDDYSIVVDVYPGNPGENTTVTVTVPEDVTGDVTVIIDGIEYPVTPVNGTATIELPLDVGNHTASATVSDDPKYEDKASDDVPFEVKKVGECPIDVVVYPGNPGENTTVTVTVPEDVTGDVTVIIDGIEYPVDPINGTATIELPLDSGNHTAIAEVTNDTKYADKQSDVTKFNIPNSCDLEIIVTVNPDHVNYGDVVEYIITVINHGPDAATGVIANISISKDFEYVSNNLTSDYKELKDLLMDSGDKQSFDESTRIWYIGDLANGETTKLAILLKAKYVGVRDVNATVKGDDIESNISNNNDSAPVTAKKASDYPIDVKITPGRPDENTTVTVTVPEDVTGDVTVIIDDVEYPVDPINGTVILDVPLPEGNHTVEVKITDDPNYEDKETEKVPFEVKKDDDYSIDVNVIPGKAGEKTKITVKVPSDADGDVTIIVDGKKYHVTPINGIATLEIPLKAGDHTVRAELTDDSKYCDKTSDDKKFTVEKIKDYDIDVDVKPGKNGETIITVHVPSDVDGEVTVVVDGKEYKVTPVNGVAVLKLNLGPGNHKVGVKLTGDSKYGDKQVNTSFNVPKSEDNSSFNVPKSEDNSSEHVRDNNKADNSLDKYATGNPILALLLVLFALGGIRLRRFKK